MRRLLGVPGDDLSRSTLSLRRYAVLTGLGLFFAALQLVLMSRFLTARQFGLLVLAISATQGILLIGDLGIARVCIDLTRSAEERSELRTQGLALTELSTVLVVTVTVVLAIASPDGDGEVRMALALGALAGVAVATDKFRATRHEVAGDQVGAAGLNFLWTNAPKVGLILGLVFLRRALWIAAAAVFFAAVVSAPSWASLRHAGAALRKAGNWLPTVVAIVASFVLTWADTYFLAAHLGVAGAGQYEALYRILGICTYLFLPWVSVLTSRLSTGEPRPMVRPMVLSLTTTAVSLAAVTAFAYWLAPRWFPALDLPLEALPGLIVFYLLMPVSFLLGLALYVRAGTIVVAKATGIAALVSLAGQTLLTLRGGPVEAAGVQAFALGVAVVLQLRAYVRSDRRPSASDVTAH